MAARNLPEMPCGPILELHGQRKRFHIPYGLKPLMEDMTMEVLKEQPPDVLEFLASFLEERVRNRETESHSRRKSWLVHRWSWEASSVLSKEAFREFIQFLPINEDNADHYATIIQAAYRGHQAREKVKEIKKSKMPGRETKQIKQIILSLEREAAFEEFIKSLNITVEEADRYATKIQAAYRGFHTREVVKESKGYAHNNGRVSVEITDDNLSEEIPDEDLLEVENEDDEQDGVVLFHSDAEETPEEEEEGSSGLEEARIYSALDSATEEEEESVTGDEMAVIDAVEDSKVGLEIDENEEEEEEDEQ